MQTRGQCPRSDHGFQTARQKLREGAETMLLVMFVEVPLR